MNRLLARLALLLLIPATVCLPATALDDDSADIDTDLQSGMRDLFPGDLFPDKPKADSSVSAQSSGGNMENKMAQQLQYYQVDAQMREQMQRVGSWLNEFTVRNQGRFPGVETGDSAGIKRQAMVQLTELVGSNPYANDGAVSGGATANELNGLSPGLPYYYNANGAPVTGTPIASDEWTSEITAENAGRINLQMDYSANQQEVNSFKESPPTWEASPGTITAIGNNQGFFYVWGAGHDGKPITAGPNSKAPLIIAQQSTFTVDDQNAPNEH